MQLTDDKVLDLLFSRLTWPSSLTRGRAARSLAMLLAKPETRESTVSAFERKLLSQNLETRSADLLLTVLMAREQIGAAIISPEVMRKQICYPSILSQLVFEELGLREDRSQWKTFHSETAPAEFFIDKAFERDIRGCLPPINWSMAESIEGAHKIHFFKQWAFESKGLMERTGLLPSPPSYFPGQSRDDHYFSLEYPQSDLYRSSFLEPLSWAHSTGRVDEGEVWLRTLRLCPVDVGLARVPVKSKPDWWPSPDGMPDEVDAAAALVWSRVGELWNRWTRDDSDWLLTMASGPLCRSENTVYTLQILGGCRSLWSLELPEIGDVFGWLATRSAGQPGDFGVTLGGKLSRLGGRETPRRFGGWEVSPVAGHLESWTGPRWQFWRLGRVWAPASEVLTEPLTIEPSEDALEFKSSGAPVARWQDWAHEFKEILEANLPPSAGQVLFMKRDLVLKSAAEQASSFCWFCKMTIYHRQSSWGQFEKIESFRTFGDVSRIITSL